MNFFKTKVTQIELGHGVFEFIKQARFHDLAIAKLPENAPKPVIEKLFRAQIYLVIVSTINYYPSKSIGIDCLIFLIYENLFKSSFQTYDEFRAFFDKDFQEFEKMLHYGEKTQNGMLFGIYLWIFEDYMKSIDPIDQLQIVPFLFDVFDTINKANEKNSKKFKLID